MIDKSITESIFLSKTQKIRLAQTLIFFVTARCNAKCDFCLYYENVDNPTAKKDELTIDEIEKISLKYGRLHYLSLSGGEPFVRRDIAEICQCFISNCKTRVIDIPSNFFYSSNMVKAVETIVSNNPDVRLELQLSIDDIGDAHNESRKVADLYDKAICTFKKLQEIRVLHDNLTMKVNIVYLERNRHKLSDIITVLSEAIEYDRVQLTYPNNLISSSPSPKEKEEVCENINGFIDAEKQAVQPLRRNRSSNLSTYLYTLGMLSVKEVYNQLLRGSIEKGVNVGSYCEAGRHILVINEKGDVFPCEPLWHKIGNLRDKHYDMKEIVEGEKYRDFRVKHLGIKKCNCSWGCAIHSHISVTSKYLPRLALNAVKIAMNS